MLETIGPTCVTKACGDCLLIFTQLAKSQGMSAQGLFTELAKRGLIEKEGKSWALTTNGKQAGGEYKETTKYGTYIVWPENMNLGTNQDTPPAAKATLTATAIGRKFELLSTCLMRSSN